MTSSALKKWPKQRLAYLIKMLFYTTTYKCSSDSFILGKRCFLSKHRQKITNVNRRKINKITQVMSKIF